MTGVPIQLAPCPFCGRIPKHGLSKVRYCQMHGDPIQDYRVWCCGGSSIGYDGSHARVSARDQQTAFSLWNQRPSLGVIPLPPEPSDSAIDEREACAKIAQMVGDKKGAHSISYRSAAWEIRDLIRGRGANRA